MTWPPGKAQGASAAATRYQTLSGKRRAPSGHQDRKAIFLNGYTFSEAEERAKGKQRSKKTRVVILGRISAALTLPPPHAALPPAVAWWDSTVIPPR